MANSYHVQNVVRRQSSRHLRVKSALRHRFKQYVAGRRLLRNQKMPLSEADYNKHKVQIDAMILDGVIALYAPDGTKVIPGAVKAAVMPAPKAPAPKVEKPAPKVEAKTETVVEVEYKPEVKPKVAKDDLSKLPHIGAARISKLKAMKVTTFAAVAKISAKELSKSLDITLDAADEVLVAARIYIG